MRRVYFDYAATTPMHPEVLAAMQPYFSEKFGNPSSVHAFGQEARAAVSEARAKVAGLIGASVAEIFFTSSGTESNNLALLGTAFARERSGQHIITTPIEHSAILKPLKFLESRGFKITFLTVDEYGLVDPAEIAKLVTDQTILVSVMQANNEVGTIEPIAEIAATIKQINAKRKNRIYFHTDAVQSVGQIPVDINALGVDLLSLSAHKFYGPKGAGALYIREGVEIEPLIRGGGQEKGLRASTENVPAIVGLGKAAEIARQQLPAWTQRILFLRDKLLRGLFEKIPDIELNGHPVERLPKNISVTIKYVEGEALLLGLDLEGIAASSGSACSSGSLEPSHVLRALGKEENDLYTSLRFSLGYLNTEEEIDYFLEVFPPLVGRLRHMSPLYKRG